MPSECTSNHDSLHGKFQRLAQRAFPGAVLLDWRRLEGGISAETTVLEIALDDGLAKKLVVKRHGLGAHGHDPGVAVIEFRSLRLARSVGLPAPEPYHLSQAGEVFSTPCVAMEYVEGAQDFSPPDPAGCVRQLAGLLSRVHEIDGSRADLAFLPPLADYVIERLQGPPDVLDESKSERRIRAALLPAWPLPSRNPAVMLHGDFWPGNVLWNEGSISALIDWEDAGRGDPLFDLAYARLEVLWAFGIDAMEELTRSYASMTDFDLTDLPYWDLAALLVSHSNVEELAEGWDAPPFCRSDVTAEKFLKARRDFIERALGAVSR